MRNKRNALKCAFLAGAVVVTGVLAGTAGVLAGDDGATGTASNVPINETTFPDENFRNYVLEQIDTNDNEVLDATEISGTKVIDCNSKSIADLKGVEYFNALTELDCSWNQLTELDLSKNTALERLCCGGNQLTELNLSKNTALTMLSCGGNQLTELDLSKNTSLYRLLCSYNQLTALNLV